MSITEMVAQMPQMAPSVGPVSTPVATPALATPVATATPIVVGDQCPCWKCDGTGYLPHFAHIDNGRCWMCGASGSVNAGKPVLRSGASCFQVGEWVWMFYGCTAEHLTICKQNNNLGAKPATVFCMAFKAGTNRRTGRLAIHGRFNIDVARMVWREAKAGKTPDYFTDAVLGLERNSCSVSRNTESMGRLPL